jgi:hypothetical protein
MFTYFVKRTPEAKTDALVEANMPLIRRILFSRALRLLPLQAQAGIVEGLACITKLFPKTFSLKNEHVMSFLSELLKMASVADGEMTDQGLEDSVVDKNGFAFCGKTTGRESRSRSQHASGAFLRRMCVVNITAAARLVCPEELPTGVQMRVSGICLLHNVIKTYTTVFFDSEPSSPVGKRLSGSWSLLRLRH